MQDEFFKELRKIQDISVNTMLCRREKYHSLNEILIDVTYDIIYRIMELIDGYENPKLQYEVIERKSLKSLNADNELHNLCEEYLEYTDI